MRREGITLRRALNRLAGDERGSAAILGAVLIVMLMSCGAFAVDLGSLYLERRTAQGAVDLAAIAAARDIDSGEAAARATLTANRIRHVTGLTVTPGNYRADLSIPASQRFKPNVEPYNAVHVSLLQEAPLYLASMVMGLNSMTLRSEAIAVTTRQAAFSIGSRLLRVEGGIANAMLEALLGGNLRLTVMDYRALADANVQLFRFMDALASELHLTGATYNQVLNADARVGHVVGAMARASSDSGHRDAAHALRTIAASTNAWDAVLPLRSLLALGPYGSIVSGSSAPGFDIAINAMDVVSAAAAVANGDRQVSLNLGAAIPGLANVLVDVAIGERMQDSPWLAVGERGIVVRTAQTRLRIVAAIRGGSAAEPVAVRVPLYAEIAYAEGRLDDITCGAEPEREAQVDVGVLPGIAELWLGEADRREMRAFSRPMHVGKARLLSTPVALVSGEAHAAITNMTETYLSFDWEDIEERRTKSTAVRDPVTALLDSLMHDLDVRVQAGGLGLMLPASLEKTVANILNAATPALDLVISRILETLGITAGEADVTVRGIRCDGAALVG